MAGALSVCVSPEFVERHLGGRGYWPVLKATLLGVPLPLCSCGVIPVAASLRRHGASRAATTSFLLSTPQTGVDSILITYALLGMTFAVFRPIVALATGLLGGLLVMLLAQSNHCCHCNHHDPNGSNDPNDPNEPKGGESPCCHEGRHESCHESCCTERGSKNVVRRALEYGFITLPRDIGVPILVGVVVSGVIVSQTSPDLWKPYLGGGVLSIAAMMLLGIPLYVCASASVPIALGLIHLGASPGAALAFLIAGPASNASTIATIWKLLGKRTVLLYLATIAASAVGGGLILDGLMPAAQIVGVAGEHCHDAASGGWLPAFWSILLLGVLAFSYAKSRRPAPRVAS